MNVRKVTEKMKLVAIVALCVVALAACGKDKPTGTEGSQKNTETESQTQNDSQKETESEKDTETQKPTETETQKETESESQNGEADTTTPSNGNNDNNNNNNSQTQQPSTTNPSGDELIGKGTASDPYMETPVVDGNTMTMSTVSIGAGKSMYYGIYRVGGMILTINDANAYVVCDGTRYDAVNGVVSFQVINALASDAVYFEIGNKGGASTSFAITFANATGSYMNPTVISSLDSRTISLAKGDEVGHYYKYTAEKTGTIRFYVSADKDSDVKVTNNNTMAQRSFGSDDNGNGYIEMSVTAGDELMIQVIAMPDRKGKFPAATITWYGQY